MDVKTAYDEERLGSLLRLLRPAPEPWVRAAYELPATRRDLSQILALAESDAEFRRSLRTDLEDAVRGAGFEPREGLLRTLKGTIE